jgi:hypothetical protein
MAKDVRALLTEHQAFYEVAPYYVVRRERPGTAPASRMVMAGYDVEIFAVRTDGRAPFMPPPRDYALGHAALQNIVKRLSQDPDVSCSVEGFSLPSTVVVGPRGHSGKPAAIFRIRISRFGLDRPGGGVEARALAALETQLKALGLARR